VHSFVAQGRLESDVVVEFFAHSAGRIDQVHVREGDKIEAGQALVTLEDDRLKAAHLEAFHAAESAKANLEQLQRGTRPELIDKARALVAELKADVEAAEAHLAEIVRGARPEDIVHAEKLLEAAAADAQTAEKLYRRSTSLQGTISASELETHQGDYAAAVALRESRQALLDRLKKGASEEVRAEARSRVASAKARLDQARAELEQLTNGPTAEEIRLAEAQYGQAKAALERAKIELGDAVIRSPLSGVVLRRFCEVGELVHPEVREPMLVVCDDAALRIRIEVAEGDLYKLREGLPAVITSEGYIDQQWQGRVTQIAPVMGRKRLFSERPSEKTDVKVLEAWITPDAPVSLPINLPVEVHVEDVVREETLVLPARAVDRDGWLRRPSGEKQQVQLGARDDGYVQILSGLTLGDRVAVQ
jgi:multidrug resistance efflux pump